jgi:hypothetical protein
MFGQRLEPAFHENVVVRFVSGGPAQFFDSGRVRDSDPNLGDEDSLGIEGNE